jgi:CRP-like cAMP-binding protein
MSMQPALPQRNIFLSMLRPPDQEQLEAYLTRFDLRTGECLHHRGSHVGQVIFPHAGLVTLAVTTPNATLQGIAVVGREAVIGGFAAAAGVPAMSDAHVHIAGAASRMPAEAFRRALDASAPMRRIAARCETAAIVQAQQSAICNAMHSVEQRICRWLLEIRDRCDSDRLLLTQSDLAAMLGVRRTTITLVAGKLQQQGAIRCRRGFVHVTSRELLEQGCCECYEAVREYTDQLFQQEREAVERPAAEIALGTGSFGP